MCLGFGRPRWPGARPAEPFTLPGNGPDNRPLFGIDVVGEIDKFWGKMVCPQILWINEWENAFPTLRPSENHT